MLLSMTMQLEGDNDVRIFRVVKDAVRKYDSMIVGLMYLLSADHELIPARCKRP
jgi:hypothetical protein